MGDVLGIASFLKEQRKCKVVLILNDEELGDAKVEFERYLEKVIDTAIVFQPTTEECAEIGLGTKQSAFNGEIAKNAMALEITNIRVIQRIRRLADSVAPILSTHDPRLMLEAAKTLTVLGWIEYMRGMAPPWDFVKGRFYGRALAMTSQGKELPEHKHWNELLDKVDMGELSELDMALQLGVRQGYFDKEALDGFIDLMALRLKKADMEAKLLKGFQLYESTLNPNEDEVVAAFMDAVKTEAKLIPAASLNAIVVALKALERSAEATELICCVIDQRETSDRDFFRSFEAITDPELKAALEAHIPGVRDDRPLRTILLDGLFGYGNVATGRLRAASVQELKDALSSLGTGWDKLVNALFHVTAVADNGKTVRENVVEALTLMSSLMKPASTRCGWKRYSRTCRHRPGEILNPRLRLTIF